MKRIVAIVSVLVFCLSAVPAAFADGPAAFSFSGQGTTYTRASVTTKSEGTAWNMSDWITLDVASNRYPEVRIFHAPGVYASSHFYYKTKSTKSHSYKEAYCYGEDVYVGCKRAGSKKANVTAQATFNP